MENEFFYTYKIELNYQQTYSIHDTLSLTDILVRVHGCIDMFGASDLTSSANSLTGRVDQSHCKDPHCRLEAVKKHKISHQIYTKRDQIKCDNFAWMPTFRHSSHILNSSV